MRCFLAGGFAVEIQRASRLYLVELLEEGEREQLADIEARVTCGAVLPIDKVKAMGRAQDVVVVDVVVAEHLLERILLDERVQGARAFEQGRVLAGKGAARAAGEDVLVARGCLCGIVELRHSFQVALVDLAMQPLQDAGKIEHVEKAVGSVIFGSLDEFRELPAPLGDSHAFVGYAQRAHQFDNSLLEHAVDIPALGLRLPIDVGASRRGE